MSVSKARRMVRDLLESAGREDLVETAVLLVSEVVTNALLHAGTTMHVSLSLDAEGLRAEISDGSTHLPVRRQYATTAGTGRGMRMLEQMVDDWGVTRHRRGKTVWFHLVTPGPAPERVELQEEDLVRRTTGETVTVRLLDTPLLLHAAWQEHAEALLREYLLASLDDEADVNPIQMHADATDAIAVLEEQIPKAEVVIESDTLLSELTDPDLSLADLDLEVPLASVPHFTTLTDALEASNALAESGRIMTPPTQPEVRAFRRWLCRQVVDQAAGAAPERWWLQGESTAHPRLDLAWDVSPVTEAATAVIAADEASQILALSRPALDLLGYDDAAAIVGRRLVAIIPERFRQAHVAGLTMYLLVGRQPLLGRPVEVPALRRDGTEVLLEMVVSAEKDGEGHQLFLAEVRRIG